MEFLHSIKFSAQFSRFWGFACRPQPVLCTPLVTEPTLLPPPKQISGYAPDHISCFHQGQLVTLITPTASWLVCRSPLKRVMNASLWLGSVTCRLTYTQWRQPMFFTGSDRTQFRLCVTVVDDVTCVQLVTAISTFHLLDMLLMVNTKQLF